MLLKIKNLNTFVVHFNKIMTIAEKLILKTSTFLLEDQSNIIMSLYN